MTPPSKTVGDRRDADARWKSEREERRAERRCPVTDTLHSGTLQRVKATISSGFADLTDLQNIEHRRQSLLSTGRDAGQVQETRLGHSCRGRSPGATTQIWGAADRRDGRYTHPEAGRPESYRRPELLSAWAVPHLSRSCPVLACIPPAVLRLSRETWAQQARAGLSLTIAIMRKVSRLSSQRTRARWGPASSTGRTRRMWSKVCRSPNLTTSPSRC